MNRPRRVAVTAPDGATSLASRNPAAPGQDTAPLDPAARHTARGIRRTQLRRATVTLALGALLLLGAPALLRLYPDLGGARLFGVPAGWLALAVLPYPLLGLLAWWQLAAAEHAERQDTGPPAPGHEVERPS